MKVLTERRYSFTTTAEREIGRDVKEKFCYIAFDYDTELKSTAERSDNQIHMLSDGNIITVGAERFRRESVFPAKCHWQRSQRSPRLHLSRATQSATSTSAKILYVSVMLPCGTNMFQGIFKSMTKILTVLSPSTMRSRWLLHQCENPQYGLEDLSCSSQHIPADEDFEGEYNDLARPSSMGGASELTILTCRISVQQCCMEIDSVSRFTD